MEKWKIVVSRAEDGVTLFDLYEDGISRDEAEYNRIEILRSKGVAWGNKFDLDIVKINK